MKRIALLLFAALPLFASGAKVAFTIDRIGLIPEGMAWDGKRFFVSSVRTRTIFAVDGDRVTEFAKELPWGVFGMTADRKRGVLWATTSALPQTEGYRPEDEGKAALLKIDLRDGRVLETLRAPGDAKHHFGDVTLAPDGEVYVSDSRSPWIFRVANDALEPFVTGPFRSLQGLAANATTLYVVDYSKGLFAIDRATRDLKLLDGSLQGVDGLVFADPYTLIGTQNGTTPNRVIRIRLTPSRLAVASVSTLLENSPLLGDPTLGVIADKRFVFNANAQWELFGDDGRIADPIALKDAVAVAIPLP